MGEICRSDHIVFVPDALETRVAQRAVVDTGEVTDAVALEHIGITDFCRRTHDGQLAAAFVEAAIACVTDHRAGVAHMRELQREFPGQPAVVAVEKREMGAGRRLDAGVARGGDAAVLRLPDRHDPGIARGGIFDQ